MEYTTIHLMRHGEVDNRNGVLYGRLPGYQLSELGHKMARKSAKYLQNQGCDIAKVVASPLLRAQQSAAPAGELFGVEVESDARLVEAGNRLEGLRVHAQPLQLAHPKRWKYYVAPWRPSWGESYRQIAERMAAVVSDTIDAVPGREALLVTHQSPIVVLRRFIEGRRLAHLPTRRECALASLTTLTFWGHTLVGLSYSEPAAPLLAEAHDMVPGKSSAQKR